MGCSKLPLLEASALLASHADKLTEDGRQRLVRHGHLPEREVMTGIGPVAIFLLAARRNKVIDHSLFRTTLVRGSPDGTSARVRGRTWDRSKA